MNDTTEKRLTLKTITKHFTFKKPILFYENGFVCIYPYMNKHPVQEKRDVTAIKATIEFDHSKSLVPISKSLEKNVNSKLYKEMYLLSLNCTSTCIIELDQ